MEALGDVHLNRRTSGSQPDARHRLIPNRIGLIRATFPSSIGFGSSDALAGAFGIAVSLLTSGQEHNHLAIYHNAIDWRRPLAPRRSPQLPGSSVPHRLQNVTRPASFCASIRKPLCSISCSHSGPERGFATSIG
jgi:hypothetical protein